MDILRTDKPPEHLSREARRIWKQICNTWELKNSPDALLILRTGLEAFDRLQQARKEIDKDGCTIMCKMASGESKLQKHPALESEKSAMAGLLQAFRMLGLEFENSGLSGRSR